MNILVTGGSGFIGTRLVTELLAAGHAVAIYDLEPSTRHSARCLQGDVCDLDSLTAATLGRDAVVHLAAEHRDDCRSAARCDAVNVGGAKNVVSAVEKAGCRRIVFTSSVAVYALNRPLTAETEPPRPYNEYGASKWEAEQVMARWAKNSVGASLVIVRPCVVFGEGNRGNVYSLLRQINRGRFVMVGDGCNRKSMAYVGNLTRFLQQCLGLPPGTHLYNYADKPDLTAAELVGLAHRMLNRPVPRWRLPRWAGLGGGCVLDMLAKVTGRTAAISASRIRKFCAETTVSTERLERTGFVRPFAMEEALRRTIRHEFGGEAPRR